ncbi:MAG: DeoR/GlpR family DNA-binding transcription regulator [Corynebacterium sp.]|nr:DeoR/GlpR family DNA-binding transcription regulator [Corynebacterium sp.]
MFTVHDRRKEIISLIHGSGHAEVTELSERFDVTAETIRRDLKALEAEGLVSRVHGGAVPQSATPDRPFRESEQKQIVEKTTIASLAVDLLPHDVCSIFLDSGTTTARFAEEIVRRYDGQPWTIVTNSLPAAVILAEGSVPNVHILGGTMKTVTRAVIGNQVVEAIGNMRADFAFMGTNGLTEAHGLSTPDMAEASVKRAMVEAAQSTVVLCDSSKCGKEFLVTFSDLDAIDIVVTDQNLDPEFQALFKNYNIKVVN